MKISLNKSLSFLANFQRAVELKVIDSFVGEFNSHGKANNSSSKIPVFVFNASNLISAQSCQATLLHEQFSRTTATILLDCEEIESKPDFFAFILDGILANLSGRHANTHPTQLSYDFAIFQRAFNECSDGLGEVVLIVEKASKLNLSYLEDFVEIWERNVGSFTTTNVPQLKFVFDDSVAFLGMKATSRDRFSVTQLALPSVLEVFDEMLVELVKTDNNFPVLLHPSLIEQLQLQNSIKSFDRLLTEIKFALIGFFSKPRTSESVAFSSDNFIFVTQLWHNLKKLRPSAPNLSPSKDLFPACFAGTLISSRAFHEIVNELKCLQPNDFVSLFSFEDKSLQMKSSNQQQSISYVKSYIYSQMIKMANGGASSTAMKDEQLNMINHLSNSLESSQRTFVRECLVVGDSVGNLRRAFDADPLTALQVALKFPSFYLNCQRKNCCSGGGKDAIISSSNLVQQLARNTSHNYQNMPDTCLLYRLSLENCSRSINILNWYKSFVSVSGSKASSPLLM